MRLARVCITRYHFQKRLRVRYRWKEELEVHANKLAFESRLFLIPEVTKTAHSSTKLKLNWITWKILPALHACLGCFGYI